MSVISSDILAGASGQAGGAAAGYEIERSLRFNSADSSYLSFQPSSAGNRKTWTWAGWVKRSKLSTNQDLFAVQPDANNQFRVIWQSDDNLQVFSKVGGTNRINVETQAVYRDVSAWYHLVISLDSSATSINIYVNGVDQSLTTITAVANVDHMVNSINPHNIGRNPSTGLYIDQYLADVHFIDGQALDPTDFGEFDDNGVWQPIEFVATGPNNGTVWSTYGAVSGGSINTLAELFDGDLNSAGITGASSGSTITYTFTSGISYSSSVRIYTNAGGSNRAVRINSDSNVAAVAGGWSTVASGSGTMNSFSVFTGTETDAAIGAIEVDGVTLIDGDTFNIGVNGFHLDFSDNSTAAALGTDTSGNDNDWTVNNLVPNEGVTYSSYVTGYLNSLFDTATYPVTNLFDGSTSTIVFSSSVSGSGIKFVPPTAITGSIELYLRNGDTANSTFSYSLDNGSSFTNLTTTGGDGSYVSIGSQTIDTTNGIIVRHVTTAGSNRVNWRAIRLDGAVLTDGDPSSIDSLFDSPQNGTQTDTGAGGEVSGNYATLNPLFQGGTYSNGNLDLTTTAGNRHYRGTIGVSSGKWYWELSPVSGATAGLIALVNDSAPATQNANQTGGYAYYSVTGNKQTSGVDASYGATYTYGDVIGVAFDADNGTLVFYKNGTSQGTAFTGLTSGPYYPACSAGSGTNTTNFVFNAGQRAFANTNVPSGYKALCTANLDDPTIADGSDYMDAALYTGNGTTQTISGLGFSPDLVWTKARSAANSHALWDTVRGVEKRLISNATDAEATRAGGLTAFTSDGFTHGDDSTGNASSTTYVAWTWDAGSSTVTNTDGSLTSSVRANPSAGFSVVTYTGTGSQATIGHGLGAAPGLIIAKRRDSSSNWDVYHSALGKDNTIFLNLTSAVIADSNHWGTSTPNSTVFGAIGAGAANNAANGSTQVAYCFAPVEGYSAFGSYTGNGSADGPFVYTGFRPRWILKKRTDAVDYWYIWDTARDPDNVVEAKLEANDSSAEYTAVDWLDITSNGFKIRYTGGDVNASGGTYIYAAFAEHPFKTARAR